MIKFQIKKDIKLFFLRKDFISFLCYSQYFIIESIFLYYRMPLAAWVAPLKI